MASAYESRAVAAQGRLIGKKIALFCDHKFEDMEVMWPKMRLEEEGAEVVVIGCHPAGTTYNGKFGYPVRSAKSIDDDGVAIADQWDALVLPGGFAPSFIAGQCFGTSNQNPKSVFVAVLFCVWLSC